MITTPENENEMSKLEDEKNEKKIRALLKLPYNRTCINCNSRGPQYVCTNFSTFICLNCSGIHREFTHRVKSVSFSKFTREEVHALIKGGNQRAREVLLRNWDDQNMKFPDNSDANKVREFINNVYVHKMYSGESSFSMHSTCVRNKNGDVDCSIGRNQTMQLGRLPGSNHEHYERSNNHMSIHNPECWNNEKSAEGTTSFLSSDYSMSSFSTSKSSNSLESLDDGRHTLIGKAMDEYLFPEDIRGCTKCDASSPKSFCTTKESFRSGSESFRSACESFDQLKEEDDLMTIIEHESFSQYNADDTQHHITCTATSGENLTVTLVTETEEWTKFDDMDGPTGLVSQTEKLTKLDQLPAVLPPWYSFEDSTGTPGNTLYAFPWNGAYAGVGNSEFPWPNSTQQPKVPNLEMLHCLAQSQGAVAHSKDSQQSSRFPQQCSQRYVAWRPGNPFAD